MLPQSQKTANLLQTASTNPQFLCCIKTSTNSRIVEFEASLETEDEWS